MSRERYAWSMALGGALLGCTVQCSEPKPASLPRMAATRANTTVLVNAPAASNAPSSAAAPLPQASADAGVAPDPDAAELARIMALDGSATTSLGGPSAGRVRDAIRFPDRGPGFYHNSKRPDGARYGTVELVQTIVRAAAVVDRELPGSWLTVNDLGLKEGGPIAQHGSHQAGRDADILFYVLDEQGAPIPSVGVPIDPKGKGWDFKDLAIPGDDQRVQLDAPRTWRFVAALLELGESSVQRIFVVEHVRAMLLAQAARVRAPKAIVQRFEDVTCQPSAPHDDHLHLRLYCTPQDLQQGCLDSTPTYPWREQALAALGLKPLLQPANRSREERDAVAARTTSAAEARKKAGAMHAKVRQFLAEREAWRKTPHPGRPYCK
jgi:penicillin-insensitive murein endopeptidase